MVDEQLQDRQEVKRVHTALDQDPLGELQHFQSELVKARSGDQDQYVAQDMEIDVTYSEATSSAIVSASSVAKRQRTVAAKSGEIGLSDAVPCVPERTPPSHYPPNAR